MITEDQFTLEVIIIDRPHLPRCLAEKSNNVQFT